MGRETLPWVLPNYCLVDRLDSLLFQKCEMSVLSNLEVILIEVYEPVHVLNCLITMAGW